MSQEQLSTSQYRHHRAVGRLEQIKGLPQIQMKELSEYHFRLWYGDTYLDIWPNSGKWYCPSTGDKGQLKEKEPYATRNFLIRYFKLSEPIFGHDGKPKRPLFNHKITTSNALPD